jgi:hypothetical protein
MNETKYRGADKSLAQSTSRSILFVGENISFESSLVLYINSNNIPPIIKSGTHYISTSGSEGDTGVVTSAHHLKPCGNCTYHLL